MRDDIRPTKRTFVFGVEVHSSTSPTGICREVGKLWEELVVGQWYAECATPKESSQWKLYLRFIFLPQSNRPLRRTTSP